MYEKLRMDYIVLAAKGQKGRVTLTRQEYDALLPLHVMNIQRGIVSSRSSRVTEMIHIMSTLHEIPGRCVRVIYEGSVGFIDGIQRLNTAFNLLNWQKAELTDVLTIELPPGRRGKQLMAVGFAWENGRIAPLKPENILDGLSSYVLEPLRCLRQACPFISCETPNPGMHNTFVTLPMVLRAWESSRQNIPGDASINVLNYALNLTFAEVKRMTPFLQLCHTAWKAYPQARRLWSGATMVTLGWIYLQYVQPQDPATACLTVKEFAKGLAALAVDDKYYQVLKGRRATAADRSIVYNALITVFGRTLPKKHCSLPCPSWVAAATQS